MNQIDPKPNQIWEKCLPALIVNIEPMASSGYFMVLYWRKNKGEDNTRKRDKEAWITLKDG